MLLLLHLRIQLNLLDMIKDIKPIIGIAGKVKSGKDTVAGMIAYIIREGLFRADYRNWSIRFDKPGITREIGAIIHFADFVKDICSRVFLINREYFDKILYKEQLCYLMDNGKFVKLNEVPSDYIIANHTILSTTSIASLLKGYNNKVAISLRTMLQYVGTELGRNQLGDNCWINATMSNASIIRNRFGFCAIADVRFANECDAIRKQKGGFVIEIKRPNDDEIKPKGSVHISESLEGINPDFVIDNDGNKFKLFHQVLSVLDKINQSSHSLRGNIPK